MSFAESLVVIAAVSVTVSTAITALVMTWILRRGGRREGS